MAVWKFTTTERGAQFVMITGIKVIPVFCAVSSGSPVPYRLLAVQNTVRVWIQSGLIMSTVKEERPLCSIALTGDGENTTVDTRKMQVLCATLR